MPIHKRWRVLSDAAENAGLISILSNRSAFVLGGDLRLKANDVIAAIDGEPITYDVDRFDSFLRQHKDLPVLLTIFRDDKLFEVFTDGPLGCSYKYADENVAAALSLAMQGREIKEKNLSPV